MSAIFPSIQCYFSYDAGHFGVVLSYSNPNSFAVNIPLTDESLNADGTKNEIDDLVFFPASNTFDGITTALPTSFAPGTVRDAAVLEIPSSGDDDRVVWDLIANQQTEQNADFTETFGGLATGTYSGAENTSGVSVSQASQCSAADANVARRMLAERGTRSIGRR